MGRSTLNQEVENPLRLAAVERGETHYHSGEPCFRGHVEKRYSNSGRCTRCVSEDRRRNIEKIGVTVFNRAKHQRRRVSRNLAAKRRWRERAALYEMLLENGLPITPGRTLKQRQNAAWDVVHELTSDAPLMVPYVPFTPKSPFREGCRKLGLDENEITAIQGRMIRHMIPFDVALTHMLARRVKIAKGRHIRHERHDRHTAKVELGKQADTFAATHGLPSKYQKYFRYVAYRGWSFDAALKATFDHIKQDEHRAAMRRGELCALANHIPIKQFRYRVNHMKWDIDRAATRPIKRGVPVDPNSVASRAKANGVNPNLAYSRMSQGWSVDRATSTPSITSKPSATTLRAKANGISASAVQSRIARGWSVNDAVTIRNTLGPGKAKNLRKRKRHAVY